VECNGSCDLRQINWADAKHRSITPQFIENDVNGALAGITFSNGAYSILMLRTWPELRSCYAELVTSVLRQTMFFEPSRRGTNNDPGCDEKSKLVSTGCEKWNRIHKMTATTLRAQSRYFGCVVRGYARFRGRLACR